MSHVLISAVLFFFLAIFLPHRADSPILLGSGPLGLESVRHREETVAHQHRDQSHDLRPLFDSSEAQHRRTQGEKRQRFSQQMRNVCELIDGVVCFLLETELIKGLYCRANVSLSSSQDTIRGRGTHK